MSSNGLIKFSVQQMGYDKLQVDSYINKLIFEYNAMHSEYMNIVTKINSPSELFNIVKVDRFSEELNEAIKFSEQPLGYDKKQVDSYVGKLINEYNSLYSEYTKLISKCNSLSGLLNMDVVEELVSEGRSLLAAMNIVVNEWRIENNNSQTSKSENAILEFFIPKATEPISESIVGSNSDVVVKKLWRESDNLQNTAYDIMDNNEKSMASDLLQTMDTICKVVDKFNRRLKRKTLKHCHHTEFNSVRELADSFGSTIRDVVKKILIDGLIPALYQGLKHTNSHIYVLTLRAVNQFLSNIGIYTLEVKQGEKVDYNTCQISEDSCENIAPHYDLVERIEEVRQYPYFMGNSQVSEGIVYVWRAE